MPSLAIVLLLIAGIARRLIPVFPADQNGSRFQTARSTPHDPHDPGDRDLRRDHRRRFKARLDARTQARVAPCQGLAHDPAVDHDRRRRRSSGRAQRSQTEADIRALRTPLPRFLARVVLDRLDRACADRSLAALRAPAFQTGPTSLNAVALIELNHTRGDTAASERRTSCLWPGGVKNAPHVGLRQGCRRLGLAAPGRVSQALRGG